MIIDDPVIARGYVMHLVEAIVVHETEAVIVPRRQEGRPVSTRSRIATRE